MACMKRVLAAFAALALSGSTALAFDRNPVGETADYKVDRDSDRTSSMVTGGSLSSEVTESLPTDGSGPAYRTTIDWSLRLQVIGERHGTRNVKVPAAYFTPEFMADLRQNGTYVGSDFKVDYLGVEDADTMNGAHYSNCDKIRIYDLPDDSSNDITDMEIVADVSEGVPVLGAVKMDMTGKYRGQRIKVGADYQP